MQVLPALDEVAMTNQFIPVPHPLKVRERWGSIDVAAERLGVSPRTVRRMISRGELPAYRVGKRLIRIDLLELDDLLRPIPATEDSR